MLRAIRHGLFGLLLLLAQMGAVAHGLEHALDGNIGDRHVCEQCLAFAPMGAGAVSSPPAWFSPAQGVACEAAVPAVSQARFLVSYRSRAPPR